MMSRSITYEEAKKRLEDRRELAEAYLRARIEARSKNSSDSNDNNNTTIERLEKVAILLNKASLTFNQAVDANGSKRRELLEEAFKAYVEIVPYLGKTPYLTYVVLKQIKNIERMLELEIEKSVKADTASIDVDSIMKEARESFL
mgnify:CR=1 FL=1